MPKPTTSNIQLTDAQRSFINAFFNMKVSKQTPISDEQRQALRLFVKSNKKSPVTHIIPENIFIYLMDYILTTHTLIMGQSEDVQLAILEYRRRGLFLTSLVFYNPSKMHEILSLANKEEKNEALLDFILSEDDFFDQVIDCIDQLLAVKYNEEQYKEYIINTFVYTELLRIISPAHRKKNMPNMQANLEISLYRSNSYVFRCIGKELSFTQEHHVIFNSRIKRIEQAAKKKLDQLTTRLNPSLTELSALLLFTLMAQAIAFTYSMLLTLLITLPSAVLVYRRHIAATDDRKLNYRNITLGLLRYHLPNENHSGRSHKRKHEQHTLTEIHDALHEFLANHSSSYPLVSDCTLPLADSSTDLESRTSKKRKSSSTDSPTQAYPTVSSLYKRLKQQRRGQRITDVIFPEKERISPLQEATPAKAASRIEMNDKTIKAYVFGENGRKALYVVAGIDTLTQKDKTKLYDSVKNHLRFARQKKQSGFKLDKNKQQKFRDKSHENRYQLFFTQENKNTARDTNDETQIPTFICQLTKNIPRK